MSFTIPTTIDIKGKSFAIRNLGDFRMVLDCFEALGDIELTKQERLFASLIIFYGDINSIEDIDKLPDIEEAVNKMYWFFNCGDSRVGTERDYKLVDWQQDSQMICAAVNKVIADEIRSKEYVHWWTFMGYYSEIGESPLSTVVRIREKIIKGQKLEKYERKFRADNPQYFEWNSKTISAQEAEQTIRDIWNSGR